jgi:hypothetical protein
MTEEQVHLQLPAFRNWPTHVDGERSEPCL